MDMPKRWKNVARTLLELREALTPSPFDHVRLETCRSWRILWGRRIREELRCRPCIDAHILEMSRTGLIPPTLSAREAYYIDARMRHAADYLCTGFPERTSESPFGDLPESWGMDRAIQWLLLDLWLDRHEEWLRQDAAFDCAMRIS